MADDVGVISEEARRVRGGTISRATSLLSVREVNRVGKGWVLHLSVRRSLKVFLLVLNLQDSRRHTLLMVRTFLPLCRLSDIFL